MTRSVTKQPEIIALKDFRLNAQSYIDKVAKGESFVVVKRSRPAFRIDPIEEQWETIADFSDLPGGGLKLDEFISRLDSLDGQNK